jgi:alpha-galactosidase
MGTKRTLDDLIVEQYVDSHGHSSVRRLVASELFAEFGYLPYFGDRHTSEFFSRYLAPDQSRIKQYGLVRTFIGERRRWRVIATRRAQALAGGKTPIEKKRSRETAADIISARVAQRDFIDVMNLPNLGQVSNLPKGVVVETPGMVNMLGFAPVMVGALPAPLANLVMPHAINQGLTVEAGLEGNWKEAFAALINDPLCSHLPIPRIKKMGLELLQANRRYLPQFFRQ